MKGTKKMAEFETKCPHCQSILSVQDDWIGMEVECPACQKNFTVQHQASTPMPAELGNSQTFTFVCPSCDAVAELPVSLLGQKYECQMCFEEHIAQATTERQCPVCGQTIKYHATVCKYCKTDLTKLPPTSAPKPEETFVFICPECDAMEFLPVSMKGQQYECKTCCETSIAEPAEERKCPYCGEKIKIKATICKYCKKTVKPLTPLPAGGAAPSQMSAGPKSIGSKLLGGGQAQQMQPVGDPPPQMHPINPASQKSRLALFLWNLVLPGAGHIYLGQTEKGIMLLVVFLFLVMPASGALTIIKGLSIFGRLLFLISCAWIFGDSFYILTKIQLGLPVDRMEFSSRSKSKALEPLMTPEMKKSNKIFSIAALVCLLLGITLPGILGTIALIAKMAH